MNKPLISIIIPTYNRAFIIRETLNSILVQTYPYWECIIVDDGSKDNTFEVVNEYVNKDNRFSLFNRPENIIKGPNSCRNYGFSRSKGDFIKWFDSDDLLAVEALEKIVSNIELSTDVVVSSLEYINFDGNFLNKKHNFISNNLIEDYIVGRVTFFTFTPTWSRSFVLEQAEIFDENITNLDDWDFNLRMLYANPEIVFLDEPLIRYRVHTNSLSHEIAKLNFNEINSEITAREKHLTLIKTNKKANVIVLKNFIILRYKYFFREAMVQKNKHRFFYLKNLLKKELAILDFKGVIKTLFGFVIFSIFNKGYKLLK